MNAFFRKHTLMEEISIKIKKNGQNMSIDVLFAASKRRMHPVYIRIYSLHVVVCFVYIETLGDSLISFIQIIFTKFDRLPQSKNQGMCLF